MRVTDNACQAKPEKYKISNIKKTRNVRSTNLMLYLYVSYVLLLFIFGFGSECFSTDVFCRAEAEEKSAESE